MKKRIAVLSVLLLFVLLHLVGCGSLDIQYELSKDGNYFIASNVPLDTSSGKAISIPAEYEGKPVKAVGEGISRSSRMSVLTIIRGVTKISLPDGLECISTNFDQTEYYKKESNWEKKTVNGVTCKALYINNYLIRVEVEGDVDETEFIPFDVKDGTKGIAYGAFLGDNSFIIHIPDSIEFMGSYARGIEIKKEGSIMLAGMCGYRIVFDGTVAQWKAMVSDRPEERRVDDPNYDGSDIKNKYGFEVVSCTDGSLVY